MSYQIYYERAYIRVKDKFIPLVCDGSNNSWEVNMFTGRDMAERNWHILNHKNRSKLLFTADEIKGIANDYEQIRRRDGTCFKSRNRIFEIGEFERWIINGMNRAYTIEEYTGMGNSLYVLDFSSEDLDEWQEYPFRTTDEFLHLLDMLKGSKRLSVSFTDNRKVIKPAGSPQSISLRKGGRYYVLKGYLFSDAYFCSIRRKSVKYSIKPDDDEVRAFPTKADARRYLNKYKDRLSRFNFTVELYDASDAECKMGA